MAMTLGFMLLHIRAYKVRLSPADSHSHTSNIHCDIQSFSIELWAGGRPRRRPASVKDKSDQDVCDPKVSKNNRPCVIIDSGSAAHSMHFGFEKVGSSGPCRCIDVSLSRMVYHSTDIISPGLVPQSNGFSLSHCQYLGAVLGH